jgi:hypothetical protein
LKSSGRLGGTALATSTFAKLSAAGEFSPVEGVAGRRGGISSSSDSKMLSSGLGIEKVHQ